MKILALETSANVASVALIEDENLICEFTLNYKLTHSQTIMPMIEKVKKISELDLKTLDAIAIANGPGSFTGLRIGAATAKGLALGLDLRIISVSTLRAMACNIPFTEKLIVPIMDARRKQVYTGGFSWNDNQLRDTIEPQQMAMADLLQRVKESGRQVIFLGDAVPMYKEDILSTLGEEQVKFAPVNSHIQKASSVALLAREKYNKGEFVSHRDLVPDYYRLSQAERELKEKSGSC